MLDAVEPSYFVSPRGAFTSAIIEVTAIRQNCSVNWCTRTGRGAVVDPGGDIDRILELIQVEGITVDQILLTHGHFDHAGGATALAEHLNIPIIGPHRGDALMLETLPEQASRYGTSSALAVTPSRWLEDGDELRIGDQHIVVRHVPGHTDGHVAYILEDSGVAFVGDILFRGAIGATTSPQRHLLLVASILTKLWPLDPETTFIPGHGPLSTFAEERRTSPMLADDLLEPHRPRIIALAEQLVYEAASEPQGA